MALPGRLRGQKRIPKRVSEMNEDEQAASRFTFRNFMQKHNAPALVYELIVLPNMGFSAFGSMPYATYTNLLL